MRIFRISWSGGNSSRNWSPDVRSPERNLPAVERGYFFCLMLCRISHKLFLSDVPEQVKSRVMAELTLENPRWLENLKMGRRNYRVSRHLKLYSTRTCGGLILPRGYGGRLARICAECGEKVKYSYCKFVWIITHCRL